MRTYQVESVGHLCRIESRIVRSRHLADKEICITGHNGQAYPTFIGDTFTGWQISAGERNGWCSRSPGDSRYATAQEILVLLGMHTP